MFDYKRYIALLGLDYRKELIKIIALNILAIPIGIGFGIMTSVIGGVISFFIALAFLNLFLSQGYEKALERRNEARTLAFIEAFSIIKIFINNAFNVYRSFEEAINYVKPIIREDLTRLLEDIDEDKTIQPYIKFARGFTPLIIEQLMIGLYQLDTEGGVRHIEGFDFMFDKFQTQKVVELRRHYDERLDAMNMWPRLGAGIIALTLLLGVVQIILGAIGEL